MFISCSNILQKARNQLYRVSTSHEMYTITLNVENPTPMLKKKVSFRADVQLELQITRSIFSGPIDFELTSFNCIAYFHYSSMVKSISLPSPSASVEHILPVVAMKAQYHYQTGSKPKIVFTES